MIWGLLTWTFPFFLPLGSGVGFSRPQNLLYPFFSFFLSPSHSPAAKPRSSAFSPPPPASAAAAAAVAETDAAAVYATVLVHHDIVFQVHHCLMCLSVNAFCFQVIANSQNSINAVSKNARLSRSSLRLDGSKIGRSFRKHFPTSFRVRRQAPEAFSKLHSPPLRDTLFMRISCDALDQIEGGPFCSSCLSMAGENCCTSAFLLLTLRRPTDPAQKHFSRLYATYTPPSTVGDREGWGWVHLGCFPTKVVAEC